MNTVELLRGVALFACIGAAVLIGLIIIATMASRRERGNRRDKENIQTWRESDSEAVQRAEQERAGFGSVPTTGSVQEYERDAGDVEDQDMPPEVNHTEEEESRQRLDDDDDRPRANPTS